MTDSSGRFSGTSSVTSPLDQGIAADQPDASSHSTAAVAQHLKETVVEVKENVQETGREALSEVTHRANRLIDTQKQMASERIDSFAEAMQEAARCVSERQPEIGRFMQQAGERIGSVATYLKRHDLRDAVYEVNRFGRQHPAILLGGLFVAGVAAARFLKASQERHQRSYAQSSASTGWASEPTEDVKGRSYSEPMGRMAENDAD